MATVSADMVTAFNAAAGACLSVIPPAETQTASCPRPREGARPVMELKHGIHLAYCTNIHRGETWANPQSSLGNEEAGGPVGSMTGSVPNGVRLELILGTGEGLSGSLVRDWVRPTLEAGR